MNDETHSLIGVQRTVRAIRLTAASVANAKIANAKALGTVTAIGPLTITIDGTTTAVPAHYIGSYTPTVGDRVICENFARQILVWGKFV